MMPNPDNLKRPRLAHQVRATSGSSESDASREMSVNYFSSMHMLWERSSSDSCQGKAIVRVVAATVAPSSESFLQ